MHDHLAVPAVKPPAGGAAQGEQIVLYAWLMTLSDFHLKRWWLPFPSTGESLELQIKRQGSQLLLPELQTSPPMLLGQQLGNS